MKRNTALALTVAVTVLGAGGTCFRAASPVSAPEPARLMSTLASVGSVAAIYLNTSRTVNAYFVSASWTPSSAPAGLPCSTTYPVPAGTILYKVIYASGNYRKCQ